MLHESFEYSNTFFWRHFHRELWKFWKKFEILWKNPVTLIAPLVQSWQIEFWDIWDHFFWGHCTFPERLSNLQSCQDSFFNFSRRTFWLDNWQIWLIWTFFNQVFKVLDCLKSFINSLLYIRQLKNKCISLTLFV